MSPSLEKEFLPQRSVSFGPDGGQLRGQQQDEAAVIISNLGGEERVGKAGAAKMRTPT